MKGKAVLIGVLAVVLLAGCAPLTMSGVAFNLDEVAPGAGKNPQVAATTAEVKDAWGQNSRVTSTWQVQNGAWVLVDSKQASGAGAGQTTLGAVGGSLPMAISLPIAARQLRPSNTNVSNTNNGGNASQAQGNLGINAQAQGQGQGQGQGQAQGQLQGQDQGQGQSTGALSPVTVLP
jgi:hypothetical protein